MSTINIVKFYFPKPWLASFRDDQLQSYIKLAYLTVSARQSYPKAVLFRSLVHLQVKSEGSRKHLRKGTWHVTLCYKSEDHLARGQHVAAHAYVRGKEDLTLLRATYRGPKPDSQLNANGKWSWAVEDESHVAQEMVYGHISTSKNRKRSGRGRT
ncbi:uncharacterized protein BO97DRAFT_404867 [Aspergillus homomorphus CBS 101889]|uniref:Uncharacterized protein n=1 Tax=Aspergillus homomorphus (strain CBS 101889) TaxID=1450537 RepID=A0A395HZH6_ASPHC|nr:hypothetical protein BO97DRAFT_404867 [Aspergillus homomorphus CBS 101889]RAL13342.1 hypothetical protein BO97DRAFT_404867 [Aspergillus homomorphus CBS 101889]